jgi:hypothetical protein
LLVVQYIWQENYIGAYQNELARERAARQEIIPTVDVYVAERTLKYGEPLEKENFRLVAWPENAIPEGTFVGEGSLYPDGERQLRVVLRAMEKDEAIMEIKVTKPGEEAGLTSQLERGMRAFALKVDVASGVSGFLRHIFFKIKIDGPNQTNYLKIFSLVAKKKKMPLNEATLIHLLKVKYPTIGNVYANYQPIFLIDQMIAICEFEGIPYQMTPDLIDRAWANMFVKDETIVK